MNLEHSKFLSNEVTVEPREANSKAIFPVPENKSNTSKPSKSILLFWETKKYLGNDQIAALAKKSNMFFLFEE